ncbi:hypothetical protein [Acinetobacter indicus]|uniref:hypothetical protein n=1 Tax=Acinetobacter indicus TaxID=756892 RepID=UPI001A8D7BAD|nr:hypothetical protein [Acinetobacter indicus]QSQ93126.1 hypothetical protein J0W32_13080 [Acinetobacter indicus]
MSKEERLNSFSIENMRIFACGSALLSLIFIFITDYTYALCLGLGSVFLFLFANFRKSFSAELPRSFVWLSFIVIIIVSVMVGSKVGSYINKSAMQQKMCGQVENIYIPTRKGIETFDLVNHKQHVKKLPYYRYKDQIQEANHQICIIYSHEEHWDQHPYIHTLSANKKSRV